MKMDQTYLLDTLKKLCETPSPTGYTEEAMKFVAEEFQAMGIRVERGRKGTLMAFVPGKNPGYRKVIAAHTDTLGAMVREIKSNGRLAMTMLGSYMGNAIECENVRIHSANKVFTGTVYTLKPSVHIHGGDAKSLERSLENMEIVLDEKVLKADDTKALGIEVGDFVSFEPRFVVTESGFVKTRHLDDKAGVSIIMTAVKAIVTEMRTAGGPVLENGVEILITGLEEIGFGGSSNISEDVEEMLCVDMGTPGMNQETDEYTVSICAKDGGMPYDLEVRRQLVSLAKEKAIGYKVDTYNFYSSDGRASLAAGYDLKIGLIGPGIYASHAYERTHVDSLMSTAALVHAYMMAK